MFPATWQVDFSTTSNANLALPLCGIGCEISQSSDNESTNRRIMNPSPIARIFVLCSETYVGQKHVNHPRNMFMGCPSGHSASHDWDV